MKLSFGQDNWHKPLITLLIFTQLFGCQGGILMKEPLENIIDEHPEKLKIIDRYQQEIEMSFLYLEGDCLKGVVVAEHSKSILSEDTICTLLIE